MNEIDVEHDYLNEEDYLNNDSEVKRMIMKCQIYGECAALGQKLVFPWHLNFISCFSHFTWFNFGFMYNHNIKHFGQSKSPSIYK